MSLKKEKVKLIEKKCEFGTEWLVEYEGKQYKLYVEDARNLYVGQEVDAFFAGENCFKKFADTKKYPKTKIQVEFCQDGTNLAKIIYPDDKKGRKVLLNFSGIPLVARGRYYYIIAKLKGENVFLAE